MSLRTIACWCMVSVGLLFSGAASGQEEQPVKFTVYADSVINANYFHVFFVDKLIRNHEALDVISLPQLREMFASGAYRKVKLMTVGGRNISHGNFAVDNDRIILGQKAPISLSDVQSITFLEKRDIGAAVAFGTVVGFLCVGGIAAIVELIEKAKGLEFETGKVLAYGGAFFLIDFLAVYTTTKEKTVYFTFSFPMTREP